MPPQLDVAMDSGNIASREKEVDMGMDDDNHDTASVGSSKAGYGRCRIQPIDTRIRLQLGQKQVCAYRVDGGRCQVLAYCPTACG